MLLSMGLLFEISIEVNLLICYNVRMKICSKCKVEKEENEFYKKQGKQLQTYCKKCLNTVQIVRWRERKKQAVIYKGGKCRQCGYNKNYSALVFHHVDPSNKEFAWDKLRLYPWKVVLTELDKCDLLCSNCHAELHNPYAELV